MADHGAHGGIDLAFVAEPDVSDAAFSLPTGTVTFLLTDVEGSSRRWEDAPAAMAAAIPRHYELLDEIITRHGGVRPVEQGEGDSVVGAFSRASDAVAAALDAQRALAAEPWPSGADLRVRMAIHTGEAQLRDAGNYFGQAVIRCARIRAIGFGGQVLVSDAAAAVIGDGLPPDAALADLGVHRLKDLGRPERVWQLTHPALPAGFPALRSLDEFRHNLPVQLTPLIGRTADVAAVAALLAEDRLVTLTGSGGVGKTRLAAAVAGELVERYPGGTWWVELASVADADGVARAVLAAAGASEAGGALAQQVALELGDEPTLLVLDNCEHLVQACADLVATVLSVNPAAMVLATSREALGVPGEVSWRVPSLGVPPTEREVDLTALSQFDAVRLFVDRARRARPSFAVDEANAPAIAQICHRLDGVPLAIELAAARCRQLSPEQIAGALDDRFRLLTGGARTLLARQQTLQASVEWSHDLLDDDERRVFRRLGVFAGPFPLEAAEVVASSFGDIDGVAVFDVIDRLAEKSLVVVGDGVDGGIRYRLLESLRAFAVDRARVAGELERLRDAHAQWLVDWLEPSIPCPTDAVVDLVEELHDNVVAALEWSSGDPEVGLRLLYAVARPWQSVGRIGSALAHADRLLFAPGVDAHGTVWAYAAATTAVLYVWSGRLSEFFDLLDRVERIGSEHDDAYLVAVARWLGGGTPAPESEVLRDEARARGFRWVESLATTAIARSLIEQPAEAAAPLAESAAFAAALGNTFLIQHAALTEALASASTGDFARGIELARMLLTSRSATNTAVGTRVLGVLGFLSCDADALRLAVETSERSRQRWPDLPSGIEDPAQRLRMFTEGERGLVHPELTTVAPPARPNDGLGVSPELWLACKDAIDAGERELVIDRVRTLARDTPVGRAVQSAVLASATGDEAHWHDALAAAAQHGVRPIVVDALEGLSVSAARSDNVEAAGRLLGAAERLRDETGYRWRYQFERERLDGVRPSIPIEAIDEGRAMTWTDAVAYAQRAHGSRKRPSSGWESLTPTEQQVVALVADGLTNPQIAEKLLMGRATVKTHLEHVYAKLGVQNRTELATAVAKRA